MPHCAVCGNPFKANPLATPGSTWKGSEASNMVLPYSGYLVKDLLMNIFAVDVELVEKLRSGNSKHMGVCRTCYRLTEQIDSYEQQILETKGDLMFRREKYVTVYKPDSSVRTKLSRSYFAKPRIEEEEEQLVVEAAAAAEIKDEDVEEENEGSTTPAADAEPRRRSKRNRVKSEPQEEEEAAAAYEPPDEAAADGGWSESDFSQSDEDEGGDSAGRTKARKKRKKGGERRRTRKVFRGSDPPLSDCQRIEFKSDILLIPDRSVKLEESENLKSSGDPALLKGILDDLLRDIDDIKSHLPSIVTGQGAGIGWDIVQLRTEEASGLKQVVPGGLTCFECGKDFKRTVYKIEHILEAHTAATVEGEKKAKVAPYVCVECGQRFEGEKEATEHAQDHHAKPEVRNVKGEALTKSREPFVAMTSIAVEDSEEATLETHSCNQCGVSSLTPLGYWYHWWRRHQKYRGQDCPVCGEAFRSATEFRRHLLVKHFGFRFSCNLCENDAFQAQSKPVIVQHMKKHDEIHRMNPDVRDAAAEDFMKRRILRCRTTVMKEENDSESPSDGAGAGRKKKTPMKLGMNVCRPNALRKARSNSKVPLNLLERTFVNPDQCLVPTTSVVERGMLRFDASLLAHFQSQLGLLKNSMPSTIDSVEADRSWSTILHKVGMLKLTMGIPGENVCMECGREFNEVTEKHAHAMEEHEGLPGRRCAFMCLECHETQEFTSESAAKNHMRSHHLNLLRDHPNDAFCHDPTLLVGGGGGATTYKCRFCALVCVSEFAYWYHVNCSHKMFRNGRCPDCKTILIGAKQFRHHVLVTHAFHRFLCPECPSKSFDSGVLFTRHIKGHMVKVKDSTDNEDANNKLAVHMQKRVKKAGTRCALCGMTLKNDNAHARHMLRMHDIKVSIQCKVCGVTLEDPRSLEQHKKSVHGVGSCHICGKSFFVKQDLIGHIERMHEGRSNVKNVMCEVCSKSFGTVFQLKTHMNVHREKSFKCQSCPKIYHWQSSLDSHMVACHMTGGAKKSFPCEFCGKTFADKSNWKSHRYTHTQEKPYHCASCGKGFIRKDVLRTHEKACRTNL